MQAFSASDFERFARRAEDDIDDEVRRLAEAADRYARERSVAGEKEAERWLQRARERMTVRLREREARERKRIGEALEARRSAFREERIAALARRFRTVLEKAFGRLAACFVRWVQARYGSGAFTLPPALAEEVDRQRFEVHESGEERVVFRQGNLTIDYSVERILEEFEPRIALRVGEAMPWRK